MSGMVCRTCEADDPVGARFCDTHAARDLRLACPDCGAPRDPAHKFCNECGTAFAAATPPTLPAASVPGTTQPTAELRVASVLFVDLADFTSLAESRDAEDVRDLLSGYFDAARTIVGTVRRGDREVHWRRGDGRVGCAQAAREDDAERAVRAALEIIDAVSTFGERAEVPGMRARAGVVTGQVAAQTNSGEGTRGRGAPVYTAARIQAAAEPGKVLVDDVTRQVSSAAIAYEDAGEQTGLKGKGEPVHLSGTPHSGGERCRGQAAPEASLEAPLVGRDHGPATDEGPVSLRHRTWRGTPGGGLRAGRRWQDATSLGVRQVHRRSGRRLPVSLGRRLLLRRRGRVLGTRGDGAPAARYSARSRPSRTRSRSSTRASTAGSPSPPSASDREFLVPRLGALLGPSPSPPGPGHVSCSRAGGCSSSASPSTSRWSWSSRTCSGP